jgi:hypothetical protein
MRVARERKRERRERERERERERKKKNKRGKMRRWRKKVTEFFLFKFLCEN